MMTMAREARTMTMTKTRIHRQVLRVVEYYYMLTTVLVLPTRVVHEILVTYRKI
jgi:hypothetical protein